MKSFFLFSSIFVSTLLYGQRMDSIPASLNNEVRIKAFAYHNKLNDLRDWIASQDSTSRIGYTRFRWPMRVASDYDFAPDYFVISNYMDINRDDNTAGQKDWYCMLGSNSLNYRGHEGNDYSTYPFFWRMMSNSSAQACAAAAGIVIKVRDTVNNDDNCMRNNSENNMANYVAILHSDSSITRYLHIKTGSARVTEGQFVEPGKILATIGSSGRSSNPHLHFDLQYFRDTTNDYNFIDPFDRADDNTPGAGCNPFTRHSWWIEQPGYLNPKINRVMTHSGVPYVTGYINSTFNNQFCPEYENAKAKNQFAAGDPLYVGIALSHVNDEDSAHVTIYYPDGSEWLTMPKPVPNTTDGSPVNFRNTLYLTMAATIPANAPPGTYKIRVVFRYRPFTGADFPYAPTGSFTSSVAYHYFTVGCVSNQELGGVTLSSYGHIVSNAISSNQHISGKVLYQAGNNIVLTPGFTAQSGSVFKARIKPCNFTE